MIFVRPKLINIVPCVPSDDVVELENLRESFYW